MSQNERTPLLANASDEETGTKPLGSEISLRWDTPAHKAVRKVEAIILIKFGIPVFFTSLAEASLWIVTVRAMMRPVVLLAECAQIFAVGRLGVNQLAAVSLGSMTANVVAFSLIQGMATGLDTLCPQSYTAAPKTTSIHALRTFWILMLILIPQLVIFWNGESILLGLRQDPVVARLASQYLKAMSFGLPGMVVFECIRRWLQAQGQCASLQAYTT